MTFARREFFDVRVERSWQRTNLTESVYHLLLGEPIASLSTVASSFG